VPHELRFSAYPNISIIVLSSNLQKLPILLSSMASTGVLRHRLLQDLAELQNKSYPNIELHLQEHDISTACLILTTEGYGAMHLTICFNDDYPLSPPTIYMDSKIVHPNIKEEGNICASILETMMDYTPAYTLKGIAMQLLSFFSSERIQQVNLCRLRSEKKRNTDQISTLKLGEG